MATVPAVLGSARLGNFRLGYIPAALVPVRQARVVIALGSAGQVRLGSLTIRDALNEAPNTCNLTVDTVATTVGQALRVTIGLDAPRVLFSGELQTVDLSYEGLPTQLAWPCTAIDDTARANHKRPHGSWTDVSATTVAQELIATFAPWFSTAGIALGLPAVTVYFDGSEGMSGAFGQLASLVGGYFKFEDRVAYLFTMDATDPPDTIDHTPGRFEDDPPITMSIDDSQVRTRVYGKGHGENVMADVLAGETIVPIADTVMFEHAGGQAISLTQRLAYTGIQIGGGGTLVGPGIAPTAAVHAWPFTGGAGGLLGNGVYQYAYTWATAAGETRPSPLATITTAPAGTAADPPSKLVNGFTTVEPGYIATDPTSWGGGPLTIGATYRYKFAWGTNSGYTLPSPASDPIVITAGVGGTAVQVSVAIKSPADIFFPNNGFGNYKVYRSVNGGAYYYCYGGQFSSSPSVPRQWINFFDNWYTDAQAQAGGEVPLTVSTATWPAFNRGLLEDLPLGPTNTTARKIYRTAVNATQLKLLTTIANNTATYPVSGGGLLDNTADGSLGANAPTGDTSGLSTIKGQVNAGSTTLLTSGGGAFDVAGGWALPGGGGDPVRYTGVSGNTLTGIPATGLGSITITLPYDSVLLAAPALTGVSGIVVPLLKGEPINIWVQRDDAAAQAERVALDLAQGRVTDGVIEGPILVDERFGQASLIARCDVELQMFSRPIVTVTYATRDIKTKSGKPVAFNLTTPPIVGTLTIQEVTIDQIGMAPGLYPRFSVSASSVRFSLDELLRRMAEVAVAGRPG